MQSKIQFTSVQRCLELSQHSKVPTQPASNSGNSVEPSRTAIGNVQALGVPPEGLQGLKIEQAEPKGRIDMSEVSPSESQVVAESLAEKWGRTKGSKNPPKVLLYAVEPVKSVLSDVVSEPPFKKKRV
jgi:hypothetical protein